MGNFIVANFDFVCSRSVEDNTELALLTVKNANNVVPSRVSKSGRYSDGELPSTVSDTGRLNCISVQTDRKSILASACLKQVADATNDRVIILSISLSQDV